MRAGRGWQHVMQGHLNLGQLELLPGGSWQSWRLWAEKGWDLSHFLIGAFCSELPEHVKRPGPGQQGMMGPDQVEAEEGEKWVDSGSILKAKQT